MSTQQATLHALQSWMQEALIFPEQAAGEQTGQLLEASSRLSATQRLAIYQRSYYLRLLKCMQEQFPALCHALGRELFDDFARQYLQALPSVSHTLYDLGRRFPDYLETSRPDREAPVEQRERWADFMVDLARFERRVFAMFDAPGHEGNAFAEQHTPDACLRLQPCFALGDYRFPVAWYYHEVRKQAEPVFPPMQRSPVAMVRIDYLTHTYLLTPTEYAFLAVLEKGGDISKALETVAQDAQKRVDDVQQAWSKPGGARGRWIEAGFFIAAE